MKHSKDNWHKRSQIERITDSPQFNDVNVRRMMGIFDRFKGLSTRAQEEMEEWLLKGETDISFEEAKERLTYYLDSMGLK